MKSWVDKTATQSTIWLVLVFHGVNGVGWKPKTGSELTDYFEYISSNKQSLWVATFQDVAKYIRERETGTVATYKNGDAITVVLRSSLTDLSYDLPLTLKTYVPEEWNAVEVQQGQRTSQSDVVRKNGTNYVMYQAIPNGEDVKLSPAVQMH